MSWHYSQALVAAFSAESSADSKPCAPSNGTHTHGMFWSPDKTTDASTRSRSGMTFRPSTDGHGEALLTWYLAASRARTSARPERAQGSTESEAECGDTWRESSVRFSLDSFSWKTHRCLWEEEVPESQVTLPRWGMLDAHGVLWERTTPEHLTSGIESGSWPTPDARDSNAEGLEAGKRRLEKYSTCGLQTAVKLWPTPNQRDWKDTGPTQGNRKSPNLGTMVHQWPTPKAADATGGGQHNCPVGQMHLRDAVKQGQPGGQLNPTWVEWLMGWPLGWTDCAALATDKFRQWCASHGIS